MITDIPFAISMLIQNIRKNIQPSDFPYQSNSTDLENTNVSGKSADIMPYFRAPKTDSKLDTIKQAIIKESNMTDSAKKYFEKIPIVSEKMKDGTLAQSSSKKYEEPYIVLSDSVDTNDKEKIKRVITHELLHQAPKIIPNILVPENKEKKKEFIDIWGSQYMNKKGNLKEEQFAEQALPKFIYSHIFKK